MYDQPASTSRQRCRSVSVPIGDRPPIWPYFPATGTHRREEMSFAIGRRSSPNGPRGIISGSRNKFSRNGSTASSESGPPSWNSTIPTRFFPAKRSEEHTSELQSHLNLVCRLLLEKKK